MIGAIAVYILIQIIGYLCWPIVAAALPSAPDRGLGISKAVGLTLVTSLAWVLVRFGTLPFTAATSLISIAMIGAVGIQLGRKQKSELSKILSRNGKLVELLFLGSFCLFLMIRAWNPEIFWGEKPMDSSFLNYFVRLESLPPTDPWAAGSPLHYYYFGYIMWGLVHKLTMLPTGIGYNICFAASAALYTTGLFTITSWVIGNPRGGIFGALLIACMSNIDLMWLILGEGKTMNFDTFWASSRTMHSPAFNEYPIWAFIFGDLHAHLMALPLVVASLCFGFQLTKRNTSVLAAVLGGLFLGSLFGFNAWDIFSLGWIAIFLLLITRRPLWELSRDGVIFLAIFFITKFIISWDVSPDGEVHWGWVYPNEFSTPFEIFRHFGLLIIPVSAALGAFVLMSFRSQEWIRATFLFPILIAPLFITEAHPKAWGTSLPALLLSSLALSAIFHPRIRSRLSYSFLFFSIGMTAIVALEHLFIMDRMNTIFKLYYGIWLCLGISAASVLSLFIEALSLRSAPKMIRWSGRGAIALLLLCGFVGTGISIGIMSTFERISGPRPTLDGSAFLPVKDGDEAALISWMNKHIHGTPIVAEAHGSSYGEFTRISMHTGLPTILGWAYHVTQRGTSQQEVEERKEDLSAIYQSSSAEAARALLGKYGAQYIVVGNVENRNYQKSALEKFKSNPSLFEEIFSSGQVYLFKVL